MVLAGLLAFATIARAQSDEYLQARKAILQSALSDLRVFVDLDSTQMPHNELDGDLSRDEVRAAVYLGLGNWASIIPGFHLRLVDTPAEANLAIRFRRYGFHIPGNATAVSFMPTQWKLTPGSFDLSCGAKAFGKMSARTLDKIGAQADSACSESANNILMFQSQNLGFKRNHFLDSRIHHEYLTAKTDRSKPFFRFLPDPKYQVWPPDRNTCVTGAPRAGVYPHWDIQCLADSDWAALPHYRELGRYEGPYDIASLVEHEFGHALLGPHTAESGPCPALPPGPYEDFGRDPVYREDRAIRKAAWQGRSSYSTLFSGNGYDAAWNIRGVFDIDARRLEGLRFAPTNRVSGGGAASESSVGAECVEAPESGGFPTSYPKVNGWIVLQKPDGSTKYVSDWSYAQRLMGWPLGDGHPVKTEWFQTGTILK